MALDILSCVLGGGSLITLIIFLIKRHDEKSEKNDKTLEEIKAIRKQQEKQEKDSVRLQILLMMYNYTEDKKEALMKCAEYYFKPKEKGGLEADWYLTDEFRSFLKTHDIECPIWFKGGIV